MLRLNIKGREARGFFEPNSNELGDYVAWLKERLLEICVKGTGELLVKRILHPHEIFPGPRSHFLPDLLLEWVPEAPAEHIYSEHIGEIRLTAANRPWRKSWGRRLRIGHRARCNAARAFTKSPTSRTSESSQRHALNRPKRRSLFRAELGFAPLSLLFRHRFGSHKQLHKSVLVCVGTMSGREAGGDNETAQIHQHYCRCGRAVAARGNRAKRKFHNWAVGEPCSQTTRAGESGRRPAIESEGKSGRVQKTSSGRKNCTTGTKILPSRMRKEKT